MSLVDPYECGESLFYDGVEVDVALADDAPAVAMDFSLEVVLLSVVGCFFEIMTLGGF